MRKRLACARFPWHSKPPERGVGLAAGLSVIFHAPRLYAMRSEARLVVVRWFVGEGRTGCGWMWRGGWELSWRNDGIMRAVSSGRFGMLMVSLALTSLSFSLSRSPLALSRSLSLEGGFIFDLIKRLLCFSIFASIHIASDKRERERETLEDRVTPSAMGEMGKTVVGG